MKRVMATVFVLAVAALPVQAQDSDVERLRKEVESLKATNDILVRKLEAQAVQLGALQNPAGPKIRSLPALIAVAPTWALQKPEMIGRKPVAAAVTAIAAEIGLVVISAGTEDGVQEGEEFEIGRAGEVVAKIVIDRSDKKWSAGKVIQKVADPKVGDRALAGISAKKAWVQERLDSIRLSVDFSNASLSEILAYLSEVSGLNFELDPAAAQKIDPAKRGTTFKVKELSGTSTLKLLTSSAHLDFRVTDDGRVVMTEAPSPEAALGPRASSPSPRSAGDSAEELRQLRKELDDVRSQVRSLSDRLMPAWQEEGVATEELSDALRSQLNLERGLLLREVREGSRAAKAGLQPMDILRDLDQAQFLRILREGGPLSFYRQGKGHVLVVDRAGR